MVVLKPNVVRGGRAIGLGNNLYLMKGRTHSKGGIDIGKNPKTGLEVENNEIMQVSPQGVRVFSAQPILGGISPAQYILGGANPNQVFNAQEQWKKINRVKDDGTKYRKGGKVDKKNFKTILSDKNEKKFITWYKNVSATLGLNENPDDLNHHYDYRGYWLANKNKDIDYTVEDFHFPDTYKQPTHPTFSVESQYAKRKYGINPKEVGHWEGENFIPGLYNNIINFRYKSDLEKQRNYAEQEYTPSEDIINYIKGIEGFRSEWYKDGNGIDTIGYGFTGKDAKTKFANGITKEQADKYFADTLAQKVKILQRDTPNWDKLNQNQRDALLSYHYNIGEGSYRNNSPKMQQALKDEDWETVVANIDYGYNDKKNPGLKKRRDYERNLFNTPVQYKYGGRQKAEAGTYTVKLGDNLSTIAKNNNLSLQQIIRYNPDIKNPDIIKVGQQIKLGLDSPIEKKSLYNLKEVRKQEANFDNIAAIQSSKHNSNYVILDKNKQKMFIYNSNNNLLDSIPTITGASNQDYNTKTYIDANGELVDMKGNNSTPAGITEISSVGIYHGVPSFQRSRVGSDNKVRKGDDIASAMHFEYGVGQGKNRSNGCVRLSTEGAKTLGRYIGIGDRIYTLPQNNKSRFVSKDGNLSFVADNVYGKAKGVKGNTTIVNGEIKDKYDWDDYNTTINKTYQPLYIDTKETGNKRYDFNKRTFADSLERNKEQIQKELGLSSSEYNTLAMVAMGIADQETKFGTAKSYIAKQILDYIGLTDKLKKIEGNNTSKSLGVGQIKYGDDNKEIKEIYNKIGVINNHNDISNEAKAIIGRLYHIYRNQYQGGKEHYKNVGLSEEEALAYLYNGGNFGYIKALSENGQLLNNQIGYGYKNLLHRMLRNKTKTNKANYAKSVSNKSDNNEYYGYYKYGGIHIKPSKRGTFTAAAKKHGMSVQGFASKVLANKGKYSSAMFKKARFAKSASKWKHKEFGGDMDFNYYITKDNIYKLGGRKKALNGTDYLKLLWNEDSNIPTPKFSGLNVDVPEVPTLSYSRRNNRITNNTSIPNPTEEQVKQLMIDDIGLGISNRSQNIVNDALKSNSRLSKPSLQNTIDKMDAVRTIDSNQPTVKTNNPGLVAQNLANGIQAGINIAGNIGSYLINRDAIRRMRGPAAPLPLRAETLPTRVSTAAQEAALRENVAKQENLLADNLSSSRSRLNATNQIRNQGIGLYNQLQDRKGEIERELITRDKLNRQGITNQNIAQVNQWRNTVRDFENKRIDLNSENTIQHLVQGPADAIAGERGFFDNLASNDRYRMTAFLEAIKSPDALRAMNSDEIKQLARRFGVRTSWLRSIGINI